MGGTSKNAKIRKKNFFLWAHIFFSVRKTSIDFKFGFGPRSMAAAPFLAISSTWAA